MGMMSTRPLNREMMWAGTACSVEVKKMDRMILSPAAGMPVKYSLSPYSAISCSLRLFSLLNTAVMGAAPNKFRHTVSGDETAAASPYRSIP